MNSITFTKSRAETAFNESRKKIGIIIYGHLSWGGVNYQVVSGPWSRGAIQNGSYTIKKKNVVVANTLGAGMEDATTGEKWFIPIAADFQTTRRGFGIHPDGNVEGTQGCIGLVGDSASKFWKAWRDSKMTERPETLSVVGDVGASGTVHLILGLAAKE
jgi:hypothetical protein